MMQDGGYGAAAMFPSVSVAAAAAAATYHDTQAGFLYNRSALSDRSALGYMPSSSPATTTVTSTTSPPPATATPPTGAWHTNDQLTADPTAAAAAAAYSSRFPYSSTSAASSYFGSPSAASSALNPYAAAYAQNMMNSWNSYSMASFQSLQRAGVTYGTNETVQNDATHTTTLENL